MLSNEIKEILKKEYPFPPPDDSLAEKLANYIREGKPLSITGREGVLEELEDEFAKTMLSALRNTTNDEEIHDIASLYSYSLDRTENFLKLDKYRTLVVGELSAGLKELPGINPPVDRPYVTSRGAFYGYKALFDPAPFHGKVQRKELILALREEGLYVKLPGSPPIYRLPLFTNPVLPLPSTVVKVPEEGLPGAEHYFNTIITFPIFTFPEERPMIQAYLDVIKETTARFI